MKEQIENLIEHYRLTSQECWDLLRELNSIDQDKLSENEKESLKMTKISTQMEHSYRKQFLNELQDLLCE